jgi:uncharacterized membrane protein
MGALQESIDVAAPVTTAYERWTRFEDHPQFMAGVVAVEMVDEEHLRWRTRMEGVEHEWQAEITEQRPDERVAWRSTTGARNDGFVTFDRLDERDTRVTVAINVDLEGYAGKIADVEAALRRRMRADLESFRQLLEAVP